jgi:hypothetical protein
MHDATNFWLVSGTSAPVIALADAVVVGDMYKLVFDLISINKRGSTATAKQKKLARNTLWRLAGPVAAAGGINYLLQAGVFLNALVFFTTGESNTSVASAKWTLFYGMGILLFVSLFQALRGVRQPKLKRIQLDRLQRSNQTYRPDHQS